MKKKVTKIKDFPGNESLRGVRFRYPGDGQVYYWYSQWEKGVWGKKDMADTKICPLFCDDLREALEWEVIFGVVKPRNKGAK